MRDRKDGGRGLNAVCKEPADPVVVRPVGASAAPALVLLNGCSLGWCCELAVAWGDQAETGRAPASG